MVRVAVLMAVVLVACEPSHAGEITYGPVTPAGGAPLSQVAPPRPEGLRYEACDGRVMTHGGICGLIMDAPPADTREHAVALAQRYYLTDGEDAVACDRASTDLRSYELCLLDRHNAKATAKWRQDRAAQAERESQYTPPPARPSHESQALRNIGAALQAGVSASQSSTPAASSVCNCHGYNGPGGPCYAGPGGPAYDGPGGPAYRSPGGPCYAGPGGPLTRDRVVRRTVALGAQPMMAPEGPHTAGRVAPVMLERAGLATE